MRRLLTAFFLTMSAITTTAFSGAPAQRPVINQDFPDPDILQIGSQLFAYATNSHGRNIQVSTANDLSGPWTKPREAMPAANLADWVGKDDNGYRQLWAPDVTRRKDGHYLMYYSAYHAIARKHCIGAALSDKPIGPFVPVGQRALVCGNDSQELIDPSAFIDSNGKHYLLYKSVLGPFPHGGHSATIQIREVAEDGVTLLGPPMLLFHADRPEEAGVVEAPTLVKRPEGYVLFYSANVFNSGRYYTNYATSPRLLGPYAKAAGEFLSGKTLDGAVHAPGGQDVNQTADRIVFHGDLNKPGGPRGMYVAKLRWVGLKPVLTR